MPQIGEFSREGSGFAGRIRSAFLEIVVVIVPVAKPGADKTPDFRIHLDDASGPEIGAAWSRIGDKAGDYLALVIDDPALPQPLRANLVQPAQDGVWVLLWRRMPHRSAAEAQQ